MKYVALGNTGLTVSEIGYGGAALGNDYTPIEDDDAEACVRAAVEEYGINFFDFAPVYGREALAERRFGPILKNTGLRDKIVLATKCGDSNIGGYHRDLTREAIRQSVENSLRRMGTDRIELMQVHDLNPREEKIVLDEALPELQRLKEKGLIGAIGLTGMHLETLARTCRAAECVQSVMLFGRYNLIDVSGKDFAAELPRGDELGLINCSVLFMGALTRKRIVERNSTATDWVTKRTPGARQLLEEACRVCDEAGADIGELAVQFGCDCASFDSTVLSMGRTVRLRQNMALLEKPYDRDLAQRVYELLKQGNIIQTMADYEA